MGPRKRRAMDRGRGQTAKSRGQGAADTGEKADDKRQRAETWDKWQRAAAAGSGRSMGQGSRQKIDVGGHETRKDGRRKRTEGRSGGKRAKIAVLG